MRMMSDVGWMSSAFSWSDYLSHCNAEAAPADVFTTVGYFTVLSARRYLISFRRYSQSSW